METKVRVYLPFASKHHAINAYGRHAGKNQQSFTLCLVFICPHVGSWAILDRLVKRKIWTPC